MSPSEKTEKVVIRKRIAATREELFDAWTDPESIRVWMCPGDALTTEATMDLRVGGKVRIVMRGVQDTYEHAGEFTAIEKPSKLAFTWAGSTTEMQPSLVTVEFLKISETETELVLTHERIAKAETRQRYQNGWGTIADKLEQYLEAKRGFVAIAHSILIAAPVEAVYPLAATSEGFTKWWAADVTELKGSVELGFFGRKTLYRFRMVENSAPKRARWICETGTEWKDSYIEFRLDPEGAGTRLRFTHGGWRGHTDYFVNCNTTWGELMYRLKAAAEGVPQGPLFLKDGFTAGLR